MFNGFVFTHFFLNWWCSWVFIRAPLNDHCYIIWNGEDSSRFLDHAGLFLGFIFFLGGGFKDLVHSMIQVCLSFRT